MDQHTENRRTAPASASASASALASASASASASAARRRKPAKWNPIPRKPRRDGWSAERQRAFIAALAELGCIEHAARSVEISVTSCYRLRRSPGAAGFAAAWDAALRQADERRIADWREAEAGAAPGQPAAG